MSRESAVNCPESRRVQTYLDGETVDIDATEQHLASCRDCAELRDQLLELRGGIHAEADYYRAGAVLRGRIGAALDREDHKRLSFGMFSRQFWAGTGGGALATVCAGLLAAFLFLPPLSDRVTDDVLTAHLRSLMPGHLVDVASGNHHTVKPWFAGRTDVSPPVAEFTREGYTLIGGRTDIVDGRRAAVTIYRHGAHIINVFAWPADDKRLPSVVSRNGYHLVFWKSGNVAFCAASDTALDELLALTRLLNAMATPDSRE
jgi:anti-sigma factor RsiW